MDVYRLIAGITIIIIIASWNTIYIYSPDLNPNFTSFSASYDFSKCASSWSSCVYITNGVLSKWSFITSMITPINWTLSFATWKMRVCLFVPWAFSHLFTTCLHFLPSSCTNAPLSNGIYHLIKLHTFRRTIIILCVLWAFEVLWVNFNDLRLLRVLRKVE